MATDDGAAAMPMMAIGGTAKRPARRLLSARSRASSPRRKGTRRRRWTSSTAPRSDALRPGDLARIHALPRQGRGAQVGVHHRVPAQVVLRHARQVWREPRARFVLRGRPRRQELVQGHGEECREGCVRGSLRAERDGREASRAGVHVPPPQNRASAAAVRQAGWLQTACRRADERHRKRQAAAPARSPR